MSPRLRDRRARGRLARRLLAAAALAAVGVAGSGCASSEPGAAGDGPSGGRSATSATRDQAVRFAQCMREHGVRAFPDPDASGELTVDGVVNGTAIDTSGPPWTSALASCEDLQPAGFTGHERSAAQQRGALAFARCIRVHGVADFPDPTPDAPLVDTRRIPSAATDAGMRALNAAMGACGRQAGDAGVSAP
ncbi:hypothetical protein SK069_08910 [Patulibacter brassicae]|uniref:DUF732 domain-containing protein n=1 Tax=Patulibacter brassicae TaxID=1705717 RepID=A0ABU4VJT1_9ACTN|nr:hypothetical protein [Patulibacter brassicae]MDX8151710.1 hypothetical protein [Patulibacter brassicae]